MRTAAYKEIGAPIARSPRFAAKVIELFGATQTSKNLENTIEALQLTLRDSIDNADMMSAWQSRTSSRPITTTQKKARESLVQFAFFWGSFEHTTGSRPSQRIPAAWYPSCCSRGN
jgi:hypothetical protein